MLESDEDALDLIEVSSRQLTQIREEYQDCLTSDSVPKAYLILYKNFLENLRSALDYTARGLYHRFSDKKAKEPKIYFPYIPYRTLSREEYDQKKMFNRALPGLEKNRPDIRDYILFLSDYDNGMEWFLGFMVITNLKKHVQLVRQPKKEDVKIELQGISIQASGFQMLEGGKIITDSGTLEGPLAAEPGVPLPLTGGGSVTPTLERYLYIKGHFHLGYADQFAIHCHKAIGHAVKSLVEDPPRIT